MRTFFVTLAGLALAGCMTSTDSIDPRGSYPDLGKGSAEARQLGRLEVIAEVDEARDAKDTLRHPRYVVYDANGHRVTEVPARDADGGEAVELPAGRYIVKVDREGGPATFWVTVEADQLTRVDVETVREAK
jgi:hypothetical protein